VSTPSLPLVLAVPVYQAERYLAHTLESLNAQGASVRWWLQDGASKDRTLEIARSFAREGDTVMSSPDAGQADAINHAMRGMGGEIIGFINGDDLLAPGSAERVLAYFREHPEVDLIYGSVDWIDSDGNITGHHQGRIESSADILDIYRVWWRHRQWVQPEVFYRRSLWEKVGGFDTRWQLAFDFDFWVRCFLAGARVAQVEGIGAQFRIHASQKSIAAETAADEIRAILGSHLAARAPIGAWRRFLLRAHLDYDLYQLGKSVPNGQKRPPFFSALLTHPQWLFCPLVRARLQSSLAKLLGFRRRKAT
jgi:glycosyltransferase involved in cell wall biosynthesis